MLARFPFLCFSTKQFSIIEEQRKLLQNLVDKNRDLCRHAQILEDENEMLRRQRAEMVLKHDALADKLAKFLVRAGSTTSTATARAQRGLVGEDVHAELNMPIASGRPSIIENKHSHRAGEDTRPPGEDNAKRPSPLTARGISPKVSTALASSALNKNEESPAARASSFLAREGTPQTRSLTPPVHTPASPAQKPTAGVSASQAGAPKEARGVDERTKRVSRYGSSSSNSRVRRGHVLR